MLCWLKLIDLQTLHVESGVVESMQGTRDTQAQDTSLRKVQWVNSQSLSELGLSSGVKKVWKMVTSHAATCQKNKNKPPQKSYKQQKL